VGGVMLCWKGPALRQEMEAGRRAAHLLGAKLEEPVSMPVAGYDWDHLILPAAKTGKTPAVYPRRAGTPKAEPLGEAQQRKDRAAEADRRKPAGTAAKRAPGNPRSESGKSAKAAGGKKP